ncbi:MAG: biopolymer transporter ExbD [Planctomycetes bacterium]|nr:biopolymer transporter ExbD [Planctomycetota bacterium]
MEFRKPSSQNEDRMQIRMAPMIDVVFLLLIFFMCVSKWKQPEGNLAAELPAKGAPIDKAPEEPPDLEKIVIKLKKSGDTVYIKMNERLCPTFDVLYNHLRILRQQVDVPVIIDVDRDVQFRFAISALNATEKAKFSNVSFAAPLAALPG